MKGFGMAGCYQLPVAFDRIPGQQVAMEIRCILVTLIEKLIVKHDAEIPPSGIIFKLGVILVPKTRVMDWNIK